ncbi:MAG: hypothetical protein E5Y51_17060 [Mesorhizobium sp.]|uniref:hypothetical protein n=1 Tax=Mesorhizobium sp. M1A.F.Ca.IN.022.06.1.1 TaxID=2493680 RepID=UPI000F74E328|nr:hypothetical protein [Mesorhizobium sp. M1A.F.Ca.IN.022.06.1.1]AZO62994.1 hypothetical protein EJ078_30040 [Mesorhizobium sp. M1A.F.Ca.IN.022.06.1.1]TIN15793.1 MAG: hypothetical protein E5Y51_17060 [Mesorhizobium sp.]
MLEGQFTPGVQPQLEQITPNFLRRRRMIQFVSQLGLLTGLKICLDAADGASLPAGSASWLDTSGNGYDFFRGSTSGSSTDDPTINGTTNGRSSSEYFSFDGGDFFRYDTTNEAWMQNLHKDNAKFSYFGYNYFANVATASGIFGDNVNAPGNIGCRLTLTASGVLGFNVSKTGASFALDFNSTLSPSANAWHAIGLSVDEAATTGFMFLDGTVQTFTSTYTTPSASNASQTFEIAARGSGDGKWANGGRMASFTMWEGAVLSQTDMANLFAITRGRYGI